jgi:hypothetical protein
MPEPSPETGFLVVQSKDGTLNGYAEFFADEDEALRDAKARVPKGLDLSSAPVYVLPVTRLLRED